MNQVTFQIKPISEALVGQLASFTPEEFQKFKESVKFFTHDNAHGIALEYIAKRFKLTKLAQIFDHLNHMQSIEGNCPPVLKAVREHYAKELDTSIKRYYGSIIAEEIEECL